MEDYLNLIIHELNVSIGRYVSKLTDSGTYMSPNYIVRAQCLEAL